jgi:flagellar P-ring protein precursor FlgI
MRFRIAATIAAALAVCSLAGATEGGVRIKDIARVEGARSNQLMGYGLVVGLDGTGDSKQSMFTPQAVANMLLEYGINVPASSIRVKNVAAVMVSAELPPFAKPGDRLDVTVSSMGDARSLQGGTLLQTPLQGADGKVYAVAQGPVSIGGFVAAAGGTEVQKNHPTVGRVPGGALVEGSVPATLDREGIVSISLTEADFATAARVAAAVNQSIGQPAASAPDAGTVLVRIPAGREADLVGFIADIGQVRVQPDAVAKVIINERTGTVIIGGNVTISPVAVSHGGLTVEITQELQVSQPAPLAPKTGQTVVVPQNEVQAREQEGALKPVAGRTVQQLVRSLNAIKVTPRDIIAILQAIKQAGALQAELEII